MFIDGYSVRIIRLSGDNSKVQTRVFAGNIGAHSTLDTIDIGSPAGNGLYADGQPLDAKTAGCNIRVNGSATHFDNGKGGGTVPLTSSEYPATQGQAWATLIFKNNTKKHSTIMNSFKDELVAFLNESSGGASPLSTSLLSKKSAKLAETTTPKLSFSVIGSARFLVQASIESNGSGIDPISKDLFDEIFESTHLEVNDAGMNLTLTYPYGNYTLTYFGPIERDFTLVISGYDSHGKVVEKEFHGFRPDHPQTLTISFDENMEELLDIQVPVKAPSEFEAVPYSCATGKCAKLIWKPSKSTGVSEYVIYRELADEPLYTELARVGAGATSYNTGEAWDIAGGYPVNGYAVSAIKADTTESFFAKEKNYVINKFPWPMYMPAVTGAGK